MNEENSNLKIMVVDDDESMRLMMTDALDEQDFNVIEAETGAEAIDLLKTQSADAILLDVNMPGEDGFTICDKIRKAEHTANIPVLMVTGCDDHDSIEKAYAVGATDFITKPMNWDLLPYRVAYIIKTSKAQDELAEAHNQLLQSEKLASIGQLAAGIAHEINNPVGFISSNIGTLEEYVKNLIEIISVYESSEDKINDDQSREAIQSKKSDLDLEYIKTDIVDLLGESNDGVIRVKKIVQDLKDFARTDKAEFEPADINACIDSTLNVANNEIKYNSTVVKEYGDLPKVECISSQINQVLLNLIVNAGHAIEKQGTITIRTRVEGENVVIEVEDTGKGVKPENINKIFDPFFTTKPVGTGTGLGLSVSYGIISKHNGRIEVDSELGRGTKFSIFLPIKAAVDRQKEE